VDIIHSFHRLREDLQTITCASFMLDLLKQVTPPEETQPDLFRLLLTSFHQMEHRSEMREPGERPPRFQDPSRPYRALIDSFQLKLLCLSGYQPRLEKCVRCGSPVLAGKLWFSFGHGGIACTPCLQGASGKMALSGAALAFLRQVIRMPVALLDRYILSDGVLKEVRDFLDAYSRFVVGKDISSHRFIQAYASKDETASSPARDTVASPGQPS
jgi:DNA repair protein RecO (recombination protein O)